MTPSHIALALTALAATSTSASAMVADTQPELRQYVHARLADANGLPDAAANSYAQLMAASPTDRRLALRTYRQALTAGNFRLAGQAAAHLDRLGILPSDGVLMLLAQAVVARDWAQANQLCDRIARDDTFTFLLPVVHGWIAVGSGAGDPLKPIDAAQKTPLASVYGRDHRIFIALATGQTATALTDLRALIAQQDARAVRMQLAAAALLAKKGDRATARTLLEGTAPELVMARERIDAGKTLAGAIDTPQLGLSELLAALAVDMRGDGKSPVPLQFARLATYLAPANANAIISAADLMSGSGYNDAALDILGRISPDDPLSESAREERTGILIAKGEAHTALVEAQKLAARPDPDAAIYVEIGSILSELDRPADAAAAYQRAIDIDTARGQPNWAHLFMKAGALDKAEQWPAAKAVLQQANLVDPAQAVVLNYLGYGMLEHGEDLGQAQLLIERAAALDPSDAAISDSLGWLYFKRGNYPGAITALERAVAADPAESVMHDHLGDAYWATGRRLEARYAWRAALVHADKDAIERLNRKMQDGLDTGAR